MTSLLRVLIHYENETIMGVQFSPDTTALAFFLHTSAEWALQPSPARDGKRCLRRTTRRTATHQRKGDTLEAHEGTPRSGTHARAGHSE